MICWKFTDGKDSTRCPPGSDVRTQWGANVTHSAPGKGSLCTDGWLHAYRSPLQAMLFDAIGGEYVTRGGHLWLAKADGRYVLAVDKLGCERLTTLRRVRLPRWSTAIAVRIAIESIAWRWPSELPAPWYHWANGWRDGRDRSAKAADAAADSVDAADAATRAAARVANATYAAYVSTVAAYISSVAADAGAYAVRAAADVGTNAGRAARGAANAVCLVANPAVVAESRLERLIRRARLIELHQNDSRPDGDIVRE